MSRSADPGPVEFREITEGDADALITLRGQTRENAISCAQLAELGVTAESVRARLRTSTRGWLCEVDGRIAGFAMADRTNGELWVLAVRPEFERRGIGARLLHLAEDWLWACGWPEIWLWTSPDTTRRAHRVYVAIGWCDAGVRNGELTMRKKRPTGGLTAPGR